MKKLNYLKNIKRKYKWLSRHLNDEYVIKSKNKMVIGSRSSHKLLQIDEKFKFLSVSYNVLDLGCAPGAGFKFVKKKMSIKFKILGIDKLSLIKKIEGVNLSSRGYFFLYYSSKNS